MLLSPALCLLSACEWLSLYPVSTSGPILTQKDWPRVLYGQQVAEMTQDTTLPPPRPFLPGIWIPPPLGSGFLWDIYLFKHGWFLEKRVSGFKVGDQGKQKESGWSGHVSEGAREGRNPPPSHPPSSQAFEDRHSAG